MAPCCSRFTPIHPRRPCRILLPAFLVFAALSWAATFSSVGSEIVISQVYGGGGNSGASFRNDFVELFNRGSNTVHFDGWSIQYASAAGTSWQVAPLSGQVNPGEYYLVQLASGGANGEALPAADDFGTLNLSASAGKVAVLTATTPLSGTCPSNIAIIDLVGYGNTASCFEGTNQAPGGSNTRAVLRASGGCVDTGENAADFFAAAPLPRNRASSVNDCSSGTGAVALHAIQGTGIVSPMLGHLVTTTTNIVTGLRNNGFFLQAPDGAADEDPATSEAVFVSAPDGLPAEAAIGNAVVVAGIIDEFKPAGDPATAPRTQIINAKVTLVETAQPLPSPALISPDDLRPDGPIDQLERFESMRVRVDSMKITGATEGFIIESSAAGISDGVFYGVLGDTPRPLREPGIPSLDSPPPDAPAGVPRFDLNPERLRVDANAQPGAARLELTAGAVVNNLVGVLDFEQRAWTLLPDARGTPVVSGNRAAVPVPAADAHEFTVASFNLQRFFDTTDDPDVDETVLTENAFNGRLNKASLAIRNVLRAPDILGVVEMENLATLQTLAGKVNSDAKAAGRTNVGYAAWLEEGNDIGGIDSGFLVNTARVAVLEVTQSGKDATYTNPLTGEQDTLNDRPPLLLRAAVPRPGFAEPLAVTVILNHLRSLSAIDDPTEGPRVRAKRRAQAEYLAGLVQERQTSMPGENLVLIGDFNAFPFNDGYVDVIGTIKGRPTPSNEVTLASADLVEPDLINLTDELPPAERYSYSFDGNGQAIDHILVSAPTRRHVSRHTYARLGVDFPESFRSSFNRPERLSDHDAAVAWFALTSPPKLMSAVIGPDGEVELSWQAEPLQNCRVEASSDLIEWTEIADVTANAEGLGIFKQSDSGQPVNRFYRIAVR